MKDLGIIRCMYFRDGLSLAEIERRTGLTRKTVRRWLKAAEGTEPKYRRRPAQDTKIAPYVAQLTKALEADARRPTRDRRTALKLYGELRAAGFAGDYSRGTEFVRRWRAEGGQAKIHAYVPLQFALGEAFQFDWSEERLVIGRIWRKILAAHLKLCASRAFVVQAYPRPYLFGVASPDVDAALCRSGIGPALSPDRHRPRALCRVRRRHPGASCSDRNRKGCRSSLQTGQCHHEPRQACRAAGVLCPVSVFGAAESRGSELERHQGLPRPPTMAATGTGMASGHTRGMGACLVGDPHPWR